MTSPLLSLPGAVAGDGVDAGVAAHYGSFNGEQRALEAYDAFVDLSHRDVVRIAGPDRLTWLVLAPLVAIVVGRVIARAETLPGPERSRLAG